MHDILAINIGEKPMQENERVWTVQEIAQQLRVSEKTVKNWIVGGELQSFRIGRRGYRVMDSDLQRFIESRKHPQDKDQKGD
jgi:excisionase family DNA binding protein